MTKVITTANIGKSPSIETQLLTSSLNEGLERRCSLEEHMCDLPNAAQAEIKLLMEDNSHLESLCASNLQWDRELIVLLSKCIIAYLGTNEYREGGEAAERHVNILYGFFDTLDRTLKYANQRFSE